MGGANGIVPMEMDNVKVTMADGSTYTISSTDLYAAMVDGEPHLPEKDDRAPITIADVKGNSQTVEWKAVASSPENKTDGAMYANETQDSLAISGFYTQFGSHHFLNALYKKMNDEADSYDELAFGKESFIVELDEEFNNNNNTFPVDITFTGYNYYKNGTPQSVSGTVHLVFSGTIDDTAFTATGFTIWSDRLILSGDSGEHGDASITFGSKAVPLSGFFGTETGGSIEFIVNNDGSKITGMMKYTTKETDLPGETVYDAEEHAFGLNEEDFPTLEF